MAAILQRGTMGRSILLAVFLLGRASGGEPGLVAHYTFDEGRGDVLKDHSGNGHDGKIHNAAWVKSPRGHALAFNGKDSFVDLGDEPALNLVGDLTIEVWLKARPVEGRDQIIVGDTGSLAVNRNFLLEIDKGSLVLEHGDSRVNEKIGLEQAKLIDKWQHLALVVEFPDYYVYLDGRLIKTGRLSVPFGQQTKSASKHIGGWWAGHFAGRIDELRLYNRALPERVVLSHFRGKQVHVPPSAKLRARLRYLSGRLHLELMCNNLPEGAGTAVLQVRRPGREKPVATQAVALQETRPGSQRAKAQHDLEAGGLAPGDYRATATVKDRQGRSLISAEASFAVPERPSWLGSKEGISDAVLPPYTPVKAAESPKGVSLGVWGRTYRLGDTPFLSGVTSQGVPLLAGPMRLVGRAGGRELKWPAGRAKVISRSPAQVVVSQEFADPGVVLTIRTTAEYDGFVRHDWELRAKKDLSLDEMALEVPLDPGLHFLFCWTRGGGTPQSGTMPAEYATSFVPFLWAGNERMGLSWFCRSDRNWLLDDPGRAIVVRRRPGGATLRFNLMNQRVGLKSGDRLKYTFAFQATPLRPMEKTTWDYRFHHISQTTHGPAEMRLKIPDAVLDKLAAGGVRTICFHEHWTDIESYPKTAYGDDLRSLVRRCHKRGIKLLLYLGFLISDLAPEWPYIGEECISMPKRGYMPYNYPPQPVQNAYIHCLHSAWADLLIDGIAALLDDFDVDGVYLDSTPMPFPCRNELHGCGYRRADGTVAPTFPVFAVRNWFKRLYTVIKQRKADGLIDAHVYDAMNSAALAYCTSYWNGEQLSPNPDLTKGLPLDRFRCEMMGVNWGVPAEFLHYRLGGYRQSHSLSLLHDVLVRAAGVNENFTLESSIWKLADDFGRKQAEFLPYWRNERYVKVTGPHGYASLYRHPRNGVLAIVSNLGRREAKIGMRLELDQLGLAGSPLRAVDGLTGDPVAVKANRIEFDLPAMGWRYVWFRKTK